MKKKVIVFAIVGLFCLVSSISTGTQIKEYKNVQTVEKTDIYRYVNEYPVMILTPETIEHWQQSYQKEKRAYINPDLTEEIKATEDYSILDLVDYIPEERNQGYCGNCWAWPSTSVLQIALYVQEGIKDRLSVQFMNTCGEKYTSGMNTIECCGGGNIEMLADFYSNTNFAIPWSNTMAYWHDGNYNNCNTYCNEIAKIPNYPIYDIDAVVIETRDVTTEQAIENIKNVLHQNKGVYFSVLYPDLENLDSFREMWSNGAEDEPYDLDYDCGSEYNPDEGVGHAMLIVGYHDVEGTENDYWIVLNSWGVTDRRPNGLLSWDMHMDYACRYSNYYAFAAKTLDVNFHPDPEAPERPTIIGPSNGEPEIEYTFTFSADDPQGDDVFFKINWENSFMSSGWEGPYSSGELVEFSHTWDEKENFVVRVKAKDINNNESPWSSFEFTMPKNKASSIPLLDFLEKYPLVFPLLRELLSQINTQ